MEGDPPARVNESGPATTIPEAVSCKCTFFVAGTAIFAIAAFAHCAIAR
jgi:hypothetical protein